MKLEPQPQRSEQCQHHFEADGGPCLICGLTRSQLIIAQQTPDTDEPPHLGPLRPEYQTPILPLQATDDKLATARHDEEVSAKAWNEGWEEGAKEARKPLVDLLQRARRNVEHSASHKAGAASRELLKEIDLALAKVKEPTK